MPENRDPYQQSGEVISRWVKDRQHLLRNEAEDFLRNEYLTMRLDRKNTGIGTTHPSNRLPVRLNQIVSAGVRRSVFLKETAQP